MGIQITGVGKELPNRTVTNDDISQLVETDSQWIEERTGIRERHVCIAESALTLAAKAAAQALTAAATPPQDIDLVIVATATPDKVVPSMGALVKKELGLSNAVAFDVNTACSGFIYGLCLAFALMENSKLPIAGNKIKKALVVGTEQLSRIVDWTDRSTCILFGDGAGAAVLEEKPEEKGVLATYMKNYDDENQSLVCDTSYRKTPFEKEVVQNETKSKDFKEYLSMQGNAVYKFAVSAVEEVTMKTLETAELEPDDIDFYVLHQANKRIIQAISKKLNQPMEKFQISIEETGNVSAASVPMALYDSIQGGKLKKGQKILLAGFGGGLSAGAVIFQM